jgi:hypothetical protein
MFSKRTVNKTNNAAGTIPALSNNVQYMALITMAGGGDGVAPGGCLPTAVEDLVGALDAAGAAVSSGSTIAKRLPEDLQSAARSHRFLDGW